MAVRPSKSHCLALAPQSRSLSVCLAGEGGDTQLVATSNRRSGRSPLQYGMPLPQHGPTVDCPSVLFQAPRVYGMCGGLGEPPMGRSGRQVGEQSSPDGAIGRWAVDPREWEWQCEGGQFGGGDHARTDGQQRNCRAGERVEGRRS